MSYAVIATFKLPQQMGAAIVAEICMGRYQGSTQSRETLKACMAQDPDIVYAVHDALIQNLDIDDLTVTYHLRYEETK